MMKIILGLAVLVCAVVGDLEMKFFGTPDCTGDVKVDHKLKTDGTCYNQSRHSHDRFVTVECTAAAYTIHTWEDDKCTKAGHDHAGKTGVCAVNPHRNKTSGLFTCTTPFDDWANEHGKVYGTTEETERRQEIFKSNLAWINKRNKELKYMTVGLNEFADMTLEEFENSYLDKSYSHNETEYQSQLNELGALPQDPNNIHVGGQCATPVRNQGSCGSCWAFAAAASLEALACIPDTENGYGHISTQELVDCACHGCNGGLAKTGLGYYKSKGYCYEKEYTYTAKTGSCGSSKCKHNPAYAGLTTARDQEGGITKALSGNFVAISIDAGGLTMMFYKNGTYGLDLQEPGSPLINCNKHSVNHAVTAVAATLGEDGTPNGNYHVKNSWGASWGDHGFFDMPAGVNCLNVQKRQGIYPHN